MADHEMAGRDYEMAKLRNFRVDGCKRDPKKSWFLKQVIDHAEFKHLPGSTSDPSKEQRKRKVKEVESKNPAASKVERKENRKGNEAESKNPAGKGDNVHNDFAFDIEDDFDNITLGDFLRQQRASRVEKNKNKALEVAEPRLCVAKPWAPGSVRWMREPAVEVGEAWVRALEMALAEPWDPEDLTCTINKNPAEFSAQSAKAFMRRVFDLNLGT